MHETPARVGIVMPLAHQLGGSEALLMHLLRHGSTRFAFTCAFLEDGPMVEQARELGYSTDVFRTTHLTDPFNYFSTMLALRRWIKRERLQAVFSWMPKAHMYAGLPAVLTNAKALWFQHGISNKDKMDRIATLFPASRVLCCSATSKEAQDSLVPKLWSAICYPGVAFASAEPIAKSEARRLLGLDADAPLVGMVARWERWKGAHIFIQAARLASLENPKAFFFLLGGPHQFDPAYADELRALAASSGLGDRLILAGQRPSNEVPLWQASADLIVHPATGQEPFGMAIVEAMGMGKIVIASDAGGPGEIIQDGVNGYLVPRGDVGALTEMLVRLLADPDSRKQVEAAAFVRGRSFSVARFAGRVDEVLEETFAE